MARFVTRTVLGGGQLAPAGPPDPPPTGATIYNIASNSTLLTAQVDGASALFASRQASIDARRNAA